LVEHLWVERARHKPLFCLPDAAGVGPPQLTNLLRAAIIDKPAVINEGFHGVLFFMVLRAYPCKQYRE